MALPLLIGAFTAITASVGCREIAQASGRLKEAELEHERIVRRFEQQNAKTNAQLDELGKRQMRTIRSFQDFFETWKQVQNKPDFYEGNKETDIFRLDSFGLEMGIAGAGMLSENMEYTVAGTVGAIAASGAIADTSELIGQGFVDKTVFTSGVELSKKLLTQAGGDSFLPGILGTELSISPTAAMGAGMLVGGLLFYIAGDTLSKKAKEAWKQVAKEAEEVSLVCSYLLELESVCNRYYMIMSQVDRMYKRQLVDFLRLVEKKKDWNFYNCSERKLVQNTAMLVALLYKMCGLRLYAKDLQKEIVVINNVGVERMITDAKKVLFLT